MAAHGLTAYFEPVGVVDKAVQDGVCISWITDQLVPAGNGELTGNEGCAPAISVFEDFVRISQKPDSRFAKSRTLVSLNPGQLRLGTGSLVAVRVV